MKAFLLHGLLVNILGVYCDDAGLNWAGCGRSEPTTRIVHGKQAFEEQFPWMVLLRALFYEGNHAMRCAASIITRQHLLTAAHCTIHKNKDADTILAHYGSLLAPNGTFAKVTGFIRHEDFVHKYKLNDIAVLMLLEPINYSPQALPICIPMQPVSIIHKQVLVAGWGTVKYQGNLSDRLLYTTVKVLPSSRCHAIYKTRKFQKKTMYCAYEYETDACQGDSGAPMMARYADDARYFQAGIVSYGVGCAEKGKPGVYTRVDAFSKWIDENINPGVKYKELRVIADPRLAFIFAMG